MASGDATPFPLKGVAYRHYFEIYDADGDLVTGAASLDSEVAKDAGTYADCTNEATEIATNSGTYYLDLTSTEMNANAVCVIVKTATAGAKTRSIQLYPAEAGDWVQLADDLLSRGISNVEGSAAFRTLAGAIACLVNKRAIVGATLTVYKTNDSTILETIALTTDGSQQPISSLDPA
jgi:hypothetical protein